MKSATDYLGLALRDLEASRADLDRQIEVIRRTLAELSGGVSAPIADSPVVRSVRDVVLEIAAGGRVFTLSEVMDALASEGSDAKYESVSSILSRLAREGALQKGPRRGSYRAAEEPSTPTEVRNLETLHPAPGPDEASSPTAQPFVTVVQ